MTVRSPRPGGPWTTFFPDPGIEDRRAATGNCPSAHPEAPHPAPVRHPGDARGPQPPRGEQQASFVEFLTLLLQDEVERRAHSQLRLRLRRVACDPTKTLAGFDVSFNSKPNKAQRFDLATGACIERREHVLLDGPTGGGTRHSAQALAHEVCRRGYEVLFVNTAKMRAHLAGGRAEGTHEQRLARDTRPDLLVPDDFGLEPLRAPGPADMNGRRSP